MASALRRPRGIGNETAELFRAGQELATYEFLQGLPFSIPDVDEVLKGVDQSPLHFALGRDPDPEFGDPRFLGYVGQELLLGARGGVVKGKSAEYLWQRGLVLAMGYDASVQPRDDHSGADIAFWTDLDRRHRRGHQLKTTERTQSKNSFVISHVTSCMENPFATIADYRREFFRLLEHQEDYELIPIIRYHVHDQFFPAGAKQSGPAIRCDLVDLPLEHFAPLEELAAARSRRTAHTILLGDPKTQMSLQVFADGSKTAASHLFTLCAQRKEKRIILNTVQNRACREWAHFWIPPIEQPVVTPVEPVRQPNLRSATNSRPMLEVTS